LSISLQLARLLGGHITLQSEEGTGSIFTLYLPSQEIESEAEIVPPGTWSPVAATSEYIEAITRDSVETESPDHHNEREKRKLNGRNVLIVDDDQRNIYALQKGLEPYNMNILTAQTGYECLQIVRENPDVDIVLLDIMMPNLDGYDTLSIIREELHLTELPIIAISAKTMKEDRERCLNAGATDFLGKPVVLKDVVSRIYRWLSPAEQ
jgi:two-component system chemotaxis sensor kinase CheA